MTQKIQKVITIKEPWASLIVNGYKEYEFRSWNTKYRGKLLIHAGKGRDNKDLTTFKDYNLEYMSGEIIGEVTLVDTILVDNNFDQKLRNIDDKVYKKSHIGLYAWKLCNIKKYDKTIPIKGKLGLWNYGGK